MKFALLVRTITHRGHVRKSNEDRISVNSWTTNASMEALAKFQFYREFPVNCFVADGMGGHVDGAVASSIAINLLTRSLQEFASEAQVAEALIGANFEIYSTMDHENVGMGTTIAGIQFQERRAIYFNVGDARIYKVTEGKIERVSIDDKPKVKSMHNRRGLITQALGGGSRYRAINPHVSSCDVTIGQKFLICSDGLTDVATDDEILQHMRNDADVETLTSLVLQRGAPDNFSIIVAEIAPLD